MGHLARIALCVSALLGTSIAAATQESVKIGIISHLSGLLADDQLSKGAAAAAADITSGGRPAVQAISQDAQSNPAHAVEKAHRLTDIDKVDALVAPASLASVLLPVAADRQVPLFLLGYLPDEIAAQYKDSKYLFHLGSSTEEFSRLANEFAKKRTVSGDNRFFLADEDNLGRLERSIRQAPNAKQLMFKQLSNESSPATIFSFSQKSQVAVERIGIANSILIGGENLKANARDLKSLFDRKVKVFAVGLRDPSIQDPGQLPASVRSLSGPSGYYTYSAIQIFSEAMRQSNKDRSRAIDSMRRGTFKTLIGGINFAPSGQCVQPQIVVYEMNQSGRFAFCASCTGVGEACSGGGCLCNDGSCTDDCCPRK